MERNDSARPFYPAETRASSEYLGVVRESLALDPNPSECAFRPRRDGGDKRDVLCSTGAEVSAMRRVLEKLGEVAPDTLQHLPDVEVVHRAKESLQCGDSESCVYYKEEMIQELGGKQAATAARDRLFKPSGPFDTAEALADGSITRLLRQWETMHPEFEAIPFQMLDFAAQPDNELLLFDFREAILHRQKRVFAVILNSDKTGGRGIHWFCMLFDFRRLTNEDVWALAKVSGRNASAGARLTRACTIEYFNSSSRSVPYAEVVTFGRELEQRLRRELPGLNVWFVTATRARQQYSKSECGMYSLYYIWKRLQGTPFTHFLLYRVLDDDMYALRKHFFHHYRPANSNNKRKLVHQQRHDPAVGAGQDDE